MLCPSASCNDLIEAHSFVGRFKQAVVSSCQSRKQLTKALELKRPANHSPVSSSCSIAQELPACILQLWHAVFNIWWISTVITVHCGPHHIAPLPFDYLNTKSVQHVYTSLVTWTIDVLCLNYTVLSLNIFYISSVYSLQQTILLTL